MNPIVRSEVQFCSWQWSVVCAGGGVVPRRLVGGDSDENVTGEVWRCCCCWTRHSSALLYSKLDRVRDVDVGNLGSVMLVERRAAINAIHVEYEMSE